MTAELKKAIEYLKEVSEMMKHGFLAEAIDTVVAGVEKPLPTDDEAGTMAASIASKSKSNLTAQEEAFFVAGFIECVKWMRYLREEETR